MRIPDRLKPARSGVPFVVGGVAAVFVAVASRSLHWSSTTTIVVAAAFVVLLAIVGPPLALLPAEIAEDRRAAALAEAQLLTVRAEARARLDWFIAQRPWREERFGQPRASFLDHLMEGHARFNDQIEQSQAWSDTEVRRMQEFALTAKATGAGKRYSRIEYSSDWVSIPKPASVRLQGVRIEPFRGSLKIDDSRRLEGILNINDVVSAASERILIASNADEPHESLYGGIMHVRDTSWPQGAVQALEMGRTSLPEKVED